MKTLTKLQAAALGSICLALLLMLLVIGTAQASSSFFATYAKTAVATSTLVYQTPGTATSTLVYDSYQCQSAGSSSCNITGSNESGTQNFLAADSATLMLQFTASSSISKLNINFEYSDDGLDWYQASPPSLVPGYATSSLAISLNTVPQYSWVFASSTIGGRGIVTGDGRDTRAIPINTPVRYERAVITCALGGANCAVWAAFIPKKQNP